jgi:predicted site-specific integrase-resolvase
MQQLKKFDFYSMGHAARELNVSHSSLYQWCRAGKVKFLRASDGSRLFDEKCIEQARALAKRSGRKFVD